MDQSGTHTGYFVRGDRRTYTAAAERDSAINFRRRHSPSQRDDKGWVVISGVQFMSAEVHDLVPRATQQLRYLCFQDKATMV